jgi:ferredoxin
LSTEKDIEIKLDFGAGNVVVMPSRCLRIAKEPTDCDICAQLCPAGAITPKVFIQEPEPGGTAGGNPEAEACLTEEKPKPDPRSILENKLGVIIGEDCIHCGLCVAACPLESLNTTKHHLKSFEKQVTDLGAKFEGIALGCARALHGVSSRLTSRALSVPCLAVLNTETWFFAAAVARGAHPDTLHYDENTTQEQRQTGNLKIYLPPFICDDCPVNHCGAAESTYTSCITEAEAWGAQNIELVSEPEELAFSPSGKLFDSLSSTSSDGKREAVENLAGSLWRSWQSAGEDLSFEKRRTEYLAKQRAKPKARTQPNQNAPRPFGKKSQRRRLLHTALEQEKELAGSVELLCVETIPELCTGCGVCVDVCSLGARRKIVSNSVLYFGKLPEEKRPKGEMAAVTDQLCCIGCSACVLQCPTGACTLARLSGEEFMNLRQS